MVLVVVFVIVVVEMGVGALEVVVVVVGGSSGMCGNDFDLFWLMSCHVLSFVRMTISIDRVVD